MSSERNDCAGKPLWAGFGVAADIQLLRASVERPAQLSPLNNLQVVNAFRQRASLMYMGIDSPVHLLFLGAVALIVLGPKRLPEVARALGKGMREFRESINLDAHDEDK